MDVEEFPAQICRAPHCKTPYEPLLDLANVLRSFETILDINFRRRERALREAVLRVECVVKDIVMRPVLERCLSGELEGKSAEEMELLGLSKEEEVEIVQRLGALLEEHAEYDHSILALSRRMNRLHQESILGSLAAVQQIVDAGREAPTSPFCLHDLIADPIRFKSSVDDYAQKDIYNVREDAQVDCYRFRVELRAAGVSGRFRGGDTEMLVNFGSRIIRLASEVVDSTLRIRTAPIMRGWRDESGSATLLYGLLRRFNECSNNPTLLLRPAAASAHRSPPSDVSTQSHIASSSTTPRTDQYSFPTPVQSSLLDITTNPSPRQQFARRSTILPPHFCPIDRCSGRPPVAGNIDIVEQLVVDLFSWSYHDKLLINYPVLKLKAMAAFGLAARTGSLAVPLVPNADMVIMRRALPSVVENCVTAGQRAQNDEEDAMLTLLLFDMTEQLRGMNGSRHPCVCDLTHCVKQLTIAVEVAKRKFEVTSTELELPIVARLQYSLTFDDMASTANALPFIGKEWEREVDDYFHFIDDTLNELVRSPFVRLDVQLGSRQLIKHLGFAGLMELSFAIDSGDHDDSRRGDVGFYNPIPELVKLITSSEVEPIGDTLANLQREGTALYNSRHLKGCLLAYVQLGIINPLDWNSRLNAASIRLRLANDTDQKYQWSRAIYDCSVAIYYGPPNFKAYYRRAVALAHLKMWRKAIPDFERALEIEPENPTAKQQLVMARMRRS